MDDFHYDGHELHCERVAMARIAAEAGTPTYVYSTATLSAHYRRMAEAFSPLDPLVCFAVKACPNVHVLRVLGDLGAGMDVVSGGELHRARLAGVPDARIVFAGVGKEEWEVEAALRGVEGGRRPATGDSSREGGVSFNIESDPECEVIAGVAARLGVAARGAIRINPGVKAGGHAYISTGTAETKFGVSIEHARALLLKYHNHPHLRLRGVHLHIGSSIVEPGPYVEAIGKAIALIDEVAVRGVIVETLDLGGGFGADYQTGDAPAAREFAAAIVPLLQARVRGGLRVLLEPGRTISANAGVLLTRVQYVKREGAKTFVVCDAGMNALIRPSLYEAFHFMWPVSVSAEHEPRRRAADMGMPGLEQVDVVGPVCETGDFLAIDRALPPLIRGDLLAVHGAGAYGMSMASRYNSRAMPAEALVSGDGFRVVRRRETLDDLVVHEVG